LIIILFALPVCYLLASYIYLAIWHRKGWLFGTITHEDGRHTLWGSLTYWAHFMACFPTALFISLCLVGGTLIALNKHVVAGEGLSTAGLTLVSAGIVFVLVVAAGSVRQIGVRQTLHYALQKFERDGVSSWGGCWNQFVLSNLVIGLGSVAAGILLGSWLNIQSADRQSLEWWRRGLMLGIAVLWFGVLCLVFRTGRRSFTEPRWLAHSVREVATYPLTAVPAGFGAILWAHYHYFPDGIHDITVPLWSVGLFVIAVILLVWQLVALRRVDVMAMSQKPSFAPQGLSVPYLLASHVFEHTADMVFIAVTAPGFYLLGLEVLAR
jgi:hypothetical protein